MVAMAPTETRLNRMRKSDFMTCLPGHLKSGLRVFGKLERNLHCAGYSYVNCKRSVRYTSLML
jgi:hypothetical protein